MPVTPPADGAQALVRVYSIHAGKYWLIYTIAVDFKGVVVKEGLIECHCREDFTAPAHPAVVHGVASGE